MSSNNRKELMRKMTEQRQRFALRKYSVGVASVLIGLTLLGGVTAHTEVTQPTAEEQSTDKLTANKDTQQDSSAVTKDEVKQSSETTPGEQNNSQKKTIGTEQVSDHQQSAAPATQAKTPAQSSTTTTPLMTLAETPAAAASTNNNQSQFNVNEWQYSTANDGITLTGYTGGLDVYIPNAKSFRDAGKLNPGQKVFLTHTFLQNLINTKKVTSITIERSDDAVIHKWGGELVQDDGNFATHLSLVRQGRGVATLTDEQGWQAYTANHQTKGLKAVNVSKDEDSDRIAAAFNNKNPALRKSFNKALDELRKDGTLAKISKKYFGKDMTK